MRIWIVVVLLIALVACQEREPHLYEGDANVFATDGEISDTLKTCYCWQTKDSLNLHITRGPFMGIAIDLTGKNNLYITSLRYYSDTNEFDGKFDLKIPVLKDSLTLSFENIGDSIRISGYFDINSEVVKFYGDGRTIKTAGTFNCMMVKK